MSIWRDIWKESVSANKQMLLARDPSANAFNSLLERYPNDGMVFYEIGEAYESLEHYNKAVEKYKKAQELFPVPHWKNVAEFAANRVERKRTNFDSVGYEEFYALQWDSFHEIHTFENLLDECRYLGISALSRIDSEANSEVVHLRTAIEIELRFLFPDLISSFGRDFCLKEVFETLKTIFKISQLDFEIFDELDNLRKEGNLSAHKNEYKGNLSKTISSFIFVMKFFNKQH